MCDVDGEVHGGADGLGAVRDTHELLEAVQLQLVHPDRELGEFSLHKIHPRIIMKIPNTANPIKI